MQARPAKPSPEWRVVAGIPARYSSTRFPGKALAPLAGRPLIEHAYRLAAAAPYVSRVIVATDDERIRRAVEAFGGEARLTRADHRSGSDRLAELMAGIECDLVVNLQGDEAVLAPQAIGEAIKPFFTDVSLQVATLKTRIRSRAELLSPHTVKVTTDADGFALSFSRQPLPLVGPEEAVDLEARPYFKHIGLYVYRRELLLRFPHLLRTPGEQRERLEQLRLLEHGIPIKVVETESPSVDVNTPEDLARAEAALRHAP